MSPRVEIILGDLHDREPLLPAPDILETIFIQDQLDVAKITFHDGPCDIITHYRGSILHLDNGDIVSRVHPISQVGNGYISLPDKGTEKCLVQRNGRWYKATAEFIGQTD